MQRSRHGASGLASLTLWTTSIGYILKLRSKPKRGLGAANVIEWNRGGTGLADSVARAIASENARMGATTGTRCGLPMFAAGALVVMASSSSTTKRVLGVSLPLDVLEKTVTTLFLPVWSCTPLKSSLYGIATIDPRHIKGKATLDAHEGTVTISPVTITKDDNTMCEMPAKLLRKTPFRDLADAWTCPVDGDVKEKEKEKDTTPFVSAALGGIRNLALYSPPKPQGGGTPLSELCDALMWVNETVVRMGKVRVKHAPRNTDLTTSSDANQLLRDILKESGETRDRPSVMSKLFIQALAMQILVIGALVACGWRDKHEARGWATVREDIDTFLDSGVSVTTRIRDGILKFMTMPAFVAWKNALTAVSAHASFKDMALAPKQDNGHVVLADPGRKLTVRRPHTRGVSEADDAARKEFIDCGVSPPVWVVSPWTAVVKMLPSMKGRSPGPLVDLTTVKHGDIYTNSQQTAAMAPAIHEVSSRWLRFHFANIAKVNLGSPRDQNRLLERIIGTTGLPRMFVVSTHAMLWHLSVQREAAEEAGLAAETFLEEDASQFATVPRTLFKWAETMPPCIASAMTQTGRHFQNTKRVFLQYSASTARIDMGHIMAYINSTLGRDSGGMGDLAAAPEHELAHWFAQQRITPGPPRTPPPPSGISMWNTATWKTVVGGTEDYNQYVESFRKKNIRNRRAFFCKSVMGEGLCPFTTTRTDQVESDWDTKDLNPDVFRLADDVERQFGARPKWAALVSGQRTYNQWPSAVKRCQSVTTGGKYPRDPGFMSIRIAFPHKIEQALWDTLDHSPPPDSTKK